VPGLVVSGFVPGIVGAHAAAAGPSVAVVATRDLRGTVSLAAGDEGVYVLRAAPFPGDASGAGWELDLLSTTTWEILRSASGDATPYGLALGFHSAWVLTGFGAMPGGAGPGVDRLDATSLRSLARIPLSPVAPDHIGVSDDGVWLLGPTELDRIDPATDGVSKASVFPNLFAEALATTPHDVLVGSVRYPGFERSGRVVVSVRAFRGTDLKLESREVIARFPGGAGDPPSAMDLAVRNADEVYVGLSSTRLGEELLVDDHGRVLGPNKAAGGLVTVSDTGIAWAAKLVPTVAAKTTVIERVSVRGAVERTVAAVPGPNLCLAAVGSTLIVAGSSQLAVLR